MEKRIFTAIVVSIAFLWIWAYFAPRLFPELAKKPEPATTTTQRTTSTSAPNTTTTAATATSATTATTPSTAAAPTIARASALVGSITPIAAAQPEHTVVEMPEYTAVFTNRGAQLVSFKLKRYLDRKKQPVDLVKQRPASSTDFPFSIEAQNRAYADRLNQALYVTRLERQGSAIKSIQYRFISPDGLSATKTFRFNGPYLFDFSISISPHVPYRTIIGPGLRTQSQEDHESKILVTGSGVVQREGSFDVLAKDTGDRFREYSQVDYVGIEDNYFLAILRASKHAGATVRRINIHQGKEIRKELYAGLNAASDGTVAGSAFFGPKETKLLESYGLERALQFGMFGIIARFLLEVLVWINQYTHNYGWAIVVLTILIKIVLYPLQHKSIVSMKKMQKLQPKMEVIKNKYKKAKTDPDQRQKMNVEMMKLYQQEKINPMSGCFPILLQLPILWGFYGLLSKAIELRGAPFMGWISDLSDKDPYYVTPILMTATMFIQTWITPTTGDPMQRKIFLFMPLMFGFIFKDMPSGLVLYWLVQNILTIVQQMIMNKWWKDHPDDNDDNDKKK